MYMLRVYIYLLFRQNLFIAFQQNLQSLGICNFQRSKLSYFRHLIPP